MHFYQDIGLKKYMRALCRYISGVKQVGQRTTIWMKDGAGRIKDYTNTSPAKPNWKWKGVSNAWWGPGPVLNWGRALQFFWDGTGRACELQDLLLITGDWTRWFRRFFPFPFRWVRASPVTVTTLLLFSFLWKYVNTVNACWLVGVTPLEQAKLALFLRFFFRSLPCRLPKMLLLMGTDVSLILCTLVYVKKVGY